MRITGKDVVDSPAGLRRFCTVHFTLPRMRGASMLDSSYNRRDFAGVSPRSHHPRPVAGTGLFCSVDTWFTHKFDYGKDAGIKVPFDVRENQATRSGPIVLSATVSEHNDAFRPVAYIERIAEWR